MTYVRGWRFAPIKTRYSQMFDVKLDEIYGCVGKGIGWMRKRLMLLPFGNARLKWYLDLLTSLCISFATFSKYTNVMPGEGNDRSETA